MSKNYLTLNHDLKELYWPTNRETIKNSNFSLNFFLPIFSCQTTIFTAPRNFIVLRKHRSFPVDFHEIYFVGLGVFQGNFLSLKRCEKVFFIVKFRYAKRKQKFLLRSDVKIRSTISELKIGKDKKAVISFFFLASQPARFYFYIQLRKP